MMKKIFFIALTHLMAFAAFAQQDAMFTHYMFNTQAVNPAYAGSRDALTVTGIHRSQWVGFGDGVPTTQTLTLHTPAFSNRLGLGLSLIQDKIGPTTTSSVYADFAYRIPVGEKSTLSIGLKAGINLFQNDLAGVITNDVDPTFSENISSDVLPNVGFGLYYQSERFYIGASIPKLIENDFEGNRSNGVLSLASEKRHYFLIAGTVLDLNSDVKLKPTTFVKVVNGAPVEFDLTGTFLIRDKFWLGAMWRTTDALGLLVGFNFTEQLSLGYSFDYSYGNETFNYNNGSHEVMLRYDFIFNNKARIKSPRYF